MTDTVAAAQANAPRLWDEHLQRRLDAEVGDPQGTQAAFAQRRAHRRFETWMQRVTGRPDGAARGGRRFTTRRPATTRYTRAAAGRRGSRTTSRSCSTSPTARARAHARRRRQLRHARLHLSGVRAGRRGRRGASDARSSGPASGRRPSSPTTRAATSRSRPSSRSTRKARSWRCAARTSATPARTPALLAAAQRRGDHVEHLPHPDRMLPRARRRVQHRSRPAPTAAPDDPKSCSSWSG